ncbi:MerR family transcriptional regulator [Microbispora sp. ATCC PTA-5024]|uniref:MerR family transcriptional regulator n=1 Tax=Microbispora sp. ATCC PTA-5024 TaxID=316330 RepID=UPI0003DDE0F6|nr:MerR family transcriptional regulator [Microbispora sp. ATCC PTA-5024]ETK37912.1 MerR family transcriptional regulator [Microbispora sp. ATCC PTA-5024]
MDEGMTIAQVAERTGLTAHTLRYYERAGLLREPPDRGGNGHRRYTERDADWIRLLTRLRATGMSIAGMRRYAELARRGEDTYAARKELLEAHRAEVLRKIEQLKDDLALVDYKINVYDKLMGDS